MTEILALPSYKRQLKNYRKASGIVDIDLPYKFKSRPYQDRFFDSMRTSRNPTGKTRAVCVWHRRSGKDKTFLNFLIPRMYERIGAYYYYFPTAAIGRDILWDGMDKDGMAFLDHFPLLLIARRNETEMSIELKNGSIFKIRGTDKREPIGINPVGCVFSEFSRQNPYVGWDLIRPILAENDGWAVFNFTPKGKNHAYRLYRMARENPAWFCEVLTADATQAISKEAIEAERQSGMSEELIQQEFYCSFDIGAEGSYYGRSMTKLWQAGQIGIVPHNPEARVFTAWDIGIGDCTAIWFVQIIGKEVRFIDYYENYGEGAEHYSKILRDKPYRYEKHYFPPDAKKREYQRDGTVASILDIYRGYLERKDPISGQRFETVELVESPGLSVGIEQVRGLLQAEGRVWFDKSRCQQGIDALENYHAEYKDKNETYSDAPAHDWSSHGADAFRYFAVAYRYQLVMDGQRVGCPRPTVVALPSEEQIWQRQPLLEFGRVK